MKKVLIRAVKYGVSICLLLFLYFKMEVNIPKIVESIKHPSYLFISFGIVVFVIPFIVINRWKYFLSLIGIKEKFFALYKITHLSQFYGLLLPSSSGFIAIKIFMIEKKYPEYRGKAGSTVFIEKAFGIYTLVFLGLLGSFLIDDIPNLIGIRLVIVSIFAFLVLVFFLLRSPLLTDWCRKIGNFSRIKGVQKIFSYLEKFSSSILNFPLKKAFLTSVFIVVMFQISTILNVYILFQVFDLDIPFIYHLGFLPIIYILAMVPVSISGLGIREGFFVYFYGLIGVDPAIAVTVSLVNYLILSVTPAVIGGFISLFSNTTLTSISQNSKPQD